MEKETTKTTKAEVKEDLNEEVEITLIKDDGKYKDDVVVVLNGVAIKVPRGKPVKIKRKYAKIIENSIAENGKTAAKITSLEKE